MKYDPNKHHRRSIRLKGYDYAQVGTYFVTVVTQDRARLFGDVVDKEIRLNEAGQVVHAVWDELKVFYPGVRTDAFVVMPNHVHGIIVLTGQTVGAAPVPAMTLWPMMWGNHRGLPLRWRCRMWSIGSKP